MGNHARPRQPLAAAGRGRPGRRRRRDLHPPDGRRRRTAPRVHPGECALASRTSTFEEPGACGSGWQSNDLPRPSPSRATICARRSGPTGGGGPTACCTCSRKSTPTSSRCRRPTSGSATRGVGGAARADRRSWPVQAGRVRGQPSSRARTGFAVAASRPRRLLKLDTRNLGWHGNALLVKSMSR